MDDTFWMLARERQLIDRPFCAYCQERGIVRRATVCDIRGGSAISLCMPCAVLTERMMAVLGFRTDTNLAGWPSDPNDPVYQGTAIVKK
jgi:hypothetical protein